MAMQYDTRRKRKEKRDVCLSAPRATRRATREEVWEVPVCVFCWWWGGSGGRAAVVEWWCPAIICHVPRAPALALCRLPISTSTSNR